MGTEHTPLPDEELLFHPLLWIFSGAFWVVGLLMFGLQIACVVHLFRTGRPYWWFWIIMSFPFVGSLAYLAVELRPQFRRWNWQEILWRFKSSAERIAIRRQQLEDSTTHANRLLLVDELRAAGRDDEACESIQEGLRGVFANDSELLLRLSSIYLHARRTEEAAEVLARLPEERSKDLQLRKKLQLARLWGQQGNIAEATELFQELIRVNRSEGPRYYYAEFLFDRGEHAAGTRMLDEIMTQYRRGTPVWRFQEREWYLAAKRLAKQSWRGRG